MNVIRASLITALALACGAVGLAAQEAPDTAGVEPEPETWAAEAGFALNATGGNEQLTVLATELSLTHLETSVYEANIGGRFRYGRSQGVDVVQNLRLNISTDFWPAARWSPFLFATAENDPFKKLEARLNGGAGVKHTFWQEGWNELSLSGAALYSYENLEVADTLGTGMTQTALWSWRGRTRREFGEGRRFEQLVYYQPEWDEFDDYLLETVTSARWALTRSLAFTTTFTYERDSTPAPEVAPDDWSLAVGLSMATQW